MSDVDAILRSQSFSETAALERATLSLRLACAELPHLSGLAAVVRLQCDANISVAAVNRYGDIHINPQIFQTLPTVDAAYILAHELMHLALDTFSREGGRSDPQLVNIAHDYIINDLLTEELRRPPPLGGLYLQGMSQRSLEDVMTELLRSYGERVRNTMVWSPDHSMTGAALPPKPQSIMSRALQEAGLVEPERQDVELVKAPTAQSSDVIWNDPPDMSRDVQLRTRRETVRTAAARVPALEHIRRLDPLRHLSGGGAGHSQWTAQALRMHYAPPWESALQRWLETQMPGDRSYSRPSRRGAERTDVVLPGRLRIGWALHIILDTSGSMLNELPEILGLIAGFCEGCSVQQVHILQCGDMLTADEWVAPGDLYEMTLLGGGGGGLCPGFERLSEDPEVKAVVVITDTYEEYPVVEPPYDVLWAVLHNRNFSPPYGTAIFLDI